MRRGRSGSLARTSADWEDLVAKSAKRRRELARQRAQRQQERRAGRAARRRRVTIVVSAVAAVAVITVISLVASGVIGGGDDVVAAPDSSSDTTPASSTEGCEYRESGSPAVPDVGLPAEFTGDQAQASTATVTLNGSPVTIQLEPAAAPCTVHSFAHLAAADYFDATTCHRLTTSDTLKVLQCGDPTGSGSGGPGYEFDNENTDGATYTAGTVAMANSGPDTNGSQFFLVYDDSDLPPDYTVFGHITDGLDVLTTIAEAGTDNGESDGAPAEPVTLDDVTTTAANPDEDAQ